MKLHWTVCPQCKKKCSDSEMFNANNRGGVCFGCSSANGQKSYDEKYNRDGTLKNDKQVLG